MLLNTEGSTFQGPGQDDFRKDAASERASRFMNGTTAAVVNSRCHSKSNKLKET